MVLSDLHFGNTEERLDLIYNAFDYCINNNIHIILCCGDFIDGTFSRGEQRISNSYEQIDYFIKNYPHNAIVKIKNSKILLHHYNPQDIIISNCNINLLGHSHKYSVSYNKNGQLNIKVPSISNINVQNYNVLPTLLEVDLCYNNDDLEFVSLIQIYYDDKLYVLNEMNYEMIRNSIYSDDMGKVKSFNQLSKFYSRYNK